MESPDLINSLSLPLSSEEDHQVVQLDSRVRVQTAGAGLAAHGMPTPGHWKIFQSKKYLKTKNISSIVKRFQIKRYCKTLWSTRLSWLLGSPLYGYNQIKSKLIWNLEQSQLLSWEIVLVFYSRVSFTDWWLELGSVLTLKRIFLRQNKIFSLWKDFFLSNCFPILDIWRLCWQQKDFYN